jgi:hypothetical protein
MSDLNELLGAVNTLKETQEKFDKKLGAIEQTTKTARTSSPAVPSIRTGEDPLTSRGFSFLRLFGLMARLVDADNCKVEREIVGRLQNAFDKADKDKLEEEICRLFRSNAFNISQRVQFDDQRNKKYPQLKEAPPKETT